MDKLKSAWVSVSSVVLDVYWSAIYLIEKRPQGAFWVVVALAALAVL